MSPVHDYVIDNSTGANVRSDINSVLQAILSNNSSSSAPSTTAAYMFWADTTTGTLKIRNSANDGWVELLQLDGTITLEDGSAATPALANRGDLDTGVFFSAANTFNVATGGVERMELGTTTVFNEDGADVDFRIEGDGRQNLFYVDAGNDRIGINTSTPSTNLHIFANAGDCTLQLESSASLSDARINLLGKSNGVSQIRFGDEDDANVGLLTYDHSSNSLAFRVNDQERCIIDSSGRFLIGISSPRTYEQAQPFGGNDTVPALQLEGAGASGGSHRVFGHTYNNSDVYAPTYAFGKTRGSAVGAVNIVNNGDPLGIISFQGADGVDLEEAAQIRAEVDGTPGSNDMPGRLIFSCTADGSHAPSEVMRMVSSGEVGIQVSAPLAQLQVNTAKNAASGMDNANNFALVLKNPSDTNGVECGLGFSVTSTTTKIGAAIVHERDSAGSQGSLKFFTRPNNTDAPVEYFRIQSDGEIRVGNYGTLFGNTGFTLDGAASGGVQAIISRENADAVLIVRKGTDGDIVEFRKNWGAGGSISIATNSVTYNTSSDYRLKENIVPISDGITRLKTLKPSRFNWIGDTSSTRDGFIAHEVTAVPEAISGTKDETYTEDEPNKNIKAGDPKYQGIDQAKLVPLITAALQEAVSKIEVLETKVAALEAA
tara:strand:- start:93 stop:2066 length:1974 start_codon:yes stop_codon:yes gene_type:complete